VSLIANRVILGRGVLPEAAFWETCVTLASFVQVAVPRRDLPAAMASVARAREARIVRLAQAHQIFALVELSPTKLGLKVHRIVSTVCQVSIATQTVS
jgi:hypothetical protein